MYICVTTVYTHVSVQYLCGLASNGQHLGPMCNTHVAQMV